MLDKRICIVQSCYIPWKGFFDLIGRCDEYVIYDRAQYVKRHWHNRNLIKTANGVEWLTIPVVTKGRFDQAIDEVEIEKPWAEKHWRSIELAYKHAPYFETLSSGLRAIFEQADREKLLTKVNELFLRELCAQLGITTTISRDTNYPMQGAKTERLLGIAKSANATHYLSGPSAQSYFDESMFKAKGITPEWMSYEGYPVYPQLHGDFDHAVSIIDVLFNMGPDARRFARLEHATGP